MIKDIPCVILAGGKSSRMGEDKALLPFGKYNTLIEYQYNKLSKIFSKVYISSKTNKFDFKCDIIYDNQKDISSPMVALQSIFTQISNKKVFIITVDIPLVKNSTILTLVKQSDDFDIVIAKQENKIHNLCGVFSISIKTNVENMILQNNHKINDLIKQSNSCITLFENTQQFLNLNTKEDYIKAQQIMNI